jgi:polyhydroxyalkanoate synthesis regulator phasin
VSDICHGDSDDLADRSPEKKDAKRLSKVIKSEGKAEARAVQGSIKELERISKLQREAAAAEVKSQQRLTKWTSKEHKARRRGMSVSKASCATPRTTTRRGGTTPLV